MYSLLTEELNNNNTNLDRINKNIFINKKTIIIDNTSEQHLLQPINGNKKEKNENSLNMHIFNPLKNSPPSIWQFRLLTRINSLNDLENFKD